MTRSLSILFAILALSPLTATAEWQTVGVFNNPISFRPGIPGWMVVTGVGTSDFTMGVGDLIDDGVNPPFVSPPNIFQFIGNTGPGILPTGAFNMGTLTMLNGNLATGAARSVELEISGFDCINEGPGCVPSGPKSGSALLNFELTGDPVGDPQADGTCVLTTGGEEVCAWTEELDTAVFAIVGAFGSLDIVEILPLSANGFVTVGRDQSANVTHLGVGVDIRPFSKKNKVNVRSRGILPVTIFGSESFDSLQVDTSSVRFGPNGAAPLPWLQITRDVNRDGFVDLTLLFRTQQIGIECDDISMVLSGATYEGLRVSGSDSVMPKGCRRR